MAVSILTADQTKEAMMSEILARAGRHEKTNRNRHLRTRARPEARHGCQLPDLLRAHRVIDC